MVKVDTIEGILDAQMDPERKAGLADYVINNNYNH